MLEIFFCYFTTIETYRDTVRETKMHILWDFSWVCVPLCRHCACFALLHQCLQARKHHNNRWLVGLWLANVKGIMLPILKNVSFFFRDSHFVSYYIQHACTLHTQHAHSCTEVDNNWVKKFLKLKRFLMYFQVFNLRQSTYSPFVRLVGVLK